MKIFLMVTLFCGLVANSFANSMQNTNIPTPSTPSLKICKVSMNGEQIDAVLEENHKVLANFISDVSSPSVEEIDFLTFYTEVRQECLEYKKSLTN